MKNQIEIVIADAQPIFRVGLRKTLAAVRRFNVVGEAADGEAAMELIKDLEPTVAILAVDLPQKDGFEVARQVLCQALPIGIVFLTVHRSEECLNSALDLGVKGYLLKDSSPTYLIDAVKAVAGGKCFVDPVLSTLLIERNRKQESFLGSTPTLNDLTECEKRILVLVSQFMTSKAIAAELFISPRTVEHHREHIADKLGLRGRNCLLKFATEHKHELG